MVETIEVEGTDVVFQNEHIPSSLPSEEQK